jgi:hypothetical protein
LKLNRNLGLAALVLLLLSAFTYRESVTRAARFERGQKFLQNLNPDEIAEISITKGEEETLLRRQGKEFVVVGANGYPAGNDSVNRFIKGVLELALEKKVGSGAGLEEELELNPAGEETIAVTFRNDADKDMVHFLVGKSAGEGASGNYVTRTDTEDGEIYLTSSQVYLRTGDDEFVKKDVVDVESSEVIRVRGGNFELADEEGTLKLVDLPAGKKETSQANSANSMLSGLRFSKQFLADAPEVLGVPFAAPVEVYLKDDSGYLVEVASVGEKHYLRIQAFHTAQQVSITQEAGDEEVQATADTLARLDEVKKFNAFHGSWVYEITEYVAKKIRLTRSDLMEDA